MVPVYNGSLPLDWENMIAFRILLKIVLSSCIPIFSMLLTPF